MNELKSILTKEYGKLPLWAWGLVALGGIGIGLYFYKRANSSKSSSTTSTIGQTTNTANSNPLDLVGSTGQGDYTASGGNANSPGQTVINVGVPTNPSNWLTTLYLTNNGPVPMYDQAGTAGSHTLGQQIATIPGGNTVQATGPEQVGAWLSNNTSELWYPVVYQGQSGYVNAYYVANASTGIQNNPVTPPATNSTYTITASDLKVKDPLHSIATKFHISYDALYNANKSVLGSDKNHAKFKAGTVLQIPSA